MTVLGILGGSGVYDIAGLEKAEWRRVVSPFGETSDEFLFGVLDGLDVVFVPRHGRGHRHSPTSINYRANIDALKRSGVTDILSLSACGSLREDLPPFGYTTAKGRRAVMSYRRLTLARLIHDGASSQGAVLVVLTVPIILLFCGAMVLLDDLAVLISHLLPMSQSDIDMFQRLMSGGVASFITLCLIAPVIEEMLFRGIFLRSFLHQYSARQAIVFSSALFGIAHLNIYQGVPAFLVGLMIGWIYLRVRSLWPCIIAHMAFNLSGYAITMLIGDAGSSSSVPEFAPLPMQILALICTVIGAHLLWKLLGPRPAGSEAPAE
mgnify:CR=1 FL=1